MTKACQFKDFLCFNRTLVFKIHFCSMKQMFLLWIDSSDTINSIAILFSGAIYN
jgi:hypothetical protein